MALICKHCESGQRPILLVAYTSSDRVFQFLCGEDGHDVDDADPIHINHVIEDDPTVLPLLKLTEDFEAERVSAQSAWAINFQPEVD